MISTLGILEKTKLWRQQKMSSSEGRGNKGRVGGTQRTYFLNCKFSYASLDIFQNP